MKIILTNGEEIAFEEWYGLNCIITTQEGAIELLSNPELTSVMDVEDDENTFRFYNVTLDDYELYEDGYHFQMHEMTAMEKKVEEVQEQVQEVVSEPTFVHIRATQSDVVVHAKERTNIKIPLTDIPEGYVFGAYRGVALGGQGTGFHKCAFQMFDSSDGGTKANISIVNFSEEEVTVDVNVTIMFMRDFGGSK